MEVVLQELKELIEEFTQTHGAPKSIEMNGVLVAYYRHKLLSETVELSRSFSELLSVGSENDIINKFSAILHIPIVFNENLINNNKSKNFILSNIHIKK